MCIWRTHWNGYDCATAAAIVRLHGVCTVKCARLFIKNEQLIKFIFQFFTRGSKIYMFDYRWVWESGRIALASLDICCVCYECVCVVIFAHILFQKQKKVAICDSLCVHRMCNNAPSTNDILLLRLCIFNGLSSTTTCNYAIPIHIFSPFSLRLRWHSFVFSDESREERVYRCAECVWMFNTVTNDRMRKKKITTNKYWIVVYFFVNSHTFYWLPFVQIIMKHNDNCITHSFFFMLFHSSQL